MENNKGLCLTCDFDVCCVFNRIFPVVFCEEFSIQETIETQKQEKINFTNPYNNETVENYDSGE
ncbi:MAG: hypothetical protein KA120_08395 [Candidatus Goldbacteria bacterium]|nr:hypothetical protein [Candidatus Goldiibacteriota bacterium]